MMFHHQYLWPDNTVLLFADMMQRFINQLDVKQTTCNFNNYDTAIIIMVKNFVNVNNCYLLHLGPIHFYA